MIICNIQKPERLTVELQYGSSHSEGTDITSYWPLYVTTTVIETVEYTTEET